MLALRRTRTKYPALFMRSQRYIYYLIGIAIVLVLVSTTFYLLETSRNEKAYSKTLKTTRLLETANLLLAEIKNAETGQRGYLLTHHKSYLEPYLSAEKQINVHYDSLYTLAEKSGAQLKKLEALKSWIAIKRAELAKTIRLHDAGKLDEALGTVNSHKGKTAMENIERLISAINEEERSKLFSQTQSFSRLNQRIQVFTIAGCYLLLVVIVAAWITIQQNRSQILLLFSQVEHKNKQLEQQKSDLQNLSRGLLNQNSELERFAYIASHDLRSPSINLVALLQLYEKAGQQQEKAELMGAIKEVSSNLLAKLDDLTDMLKRKNEIKTEYETLHFEDVYRSILKSISADLKKTQAQLDHDFTEAPIIRYPKSYLESIMQNLLTNAIKYRHPDRKPHISIKTWLTNSKVYMTVKDNGLGIDTKKYGDKIFGIYQTFHRDKESKGIGLYITKAQIVAMGGTIHVDSTPGEGTTFTICFN